MNTTRWELAVDRPGFSLMATNQVPVVEDGIRYWNSQPASVDGVLGKLHVIYHKIRLTCLHLGGYGTGVQIVS